MTIFGLILPCYGCFSVFTEAVYLVAFHPPLAQATTPRDRPRGRCAFVIHTFGIVSCLVAEENL
jgi:hypothetical protein